jgi:large subunit ribosomal protein L9
MEVILLEKVYNLGELGDKVKVKPGYGRNFLIPSGKAVSATKENVAIFEERKAELQRQQQEALSIATSRAEKFKEVTVTIAKKAGSEGKLFGSIGTIDIAESVSALGTELEKQEIRMPEGPIRAIGEYEFDIQLHADVSASIKVVVVAEEDV